jgi:hypothetical protein
VFGRRTGPSTQPNPLDKVGCPTPPMGWIGAPTSGFVQPDGHPNEDLSEFLDLSELQISQILSQSE